MTGIREIELIFLALMVFIIVFGLVARRLGTPYPIVMVVGGLALGLLPGIPTVTLDPDFVFLVILPPLLYAAAWNSSWRDFRHNLVSILFLAFGLVAFTVGAVALIAPLIFPGFDWRLGFVLGAIVAPTDAIAATAIARRVGLPSRIVDILEGESLINDASGLLALEFATATLVSNRLPTIGSGAASFVWLTIGGIGIGLLVGWIVYSIERRVDDGSIEIALSILVPYAAYLAAERVHASGVLAVVACGLFLSRRSAEFFSPSVRIQAWSFWDTWTYVLNGLVFVLIGLQLPSIRLSISEYHLATLVWSGILFSAVLIVLRLLWVFPGAWASWIVRTRLLKQDERPPRARQSLIVGWTGMRGVVSLGAALALPTVLLDGSPFPHRNAIVFLAFCVICVTLVLQGLTLPPLIRSVGLAGAAGPNCEEQEARRIVIQAAIRHLDEAKSRESALLVPQYEDLSRHYRQRLAHLQSADGDLENPPDHHRYAALSREALQVERTTAIRLRDGGRINDEVLRRIERELDFNESSLVAADERYQG